MGCCLAIIVAGLIIAMLLIFPVGGAAQLILQGSTDQQTINSVTFIGVIIGTIVVLVFMGKNLDKM